MNAGAAIDMTVRFSLDEHAAFARGAAQLGYGSLWTGEARDYDAFLLCARRWTSSNDATPGGLLVGTASSPVTFRTPMALAMAAGTLTTWTNGRFVLGVSSSAIHQESTRRAFGLPDYSPVALMRDYLTILRRLLGGEGVDHQGDAVTLRGYRLNAPPPTRTPVFVGALGPGLLRVAGELADGVILNWSTPEHLAWSRERIAEGAARAGRDPGEITVAGLFRVCVNDDRDVARRALAQSLIRGPLGPSGSQYKTLGYRGHFDRMGFGETTARLDQLRANQAPEPELVDAISPEELERVGYFGPASGAAEAVERWAAAGNIDIPVLMAVTTQPGLEPVLDTLRVARPKPATA